MGVFLVREPKENMVAAAGFKNVAVGTWLDANVAAVSGTGVGELGIPSRGFASFANGYAAALGAEAHGGPKVFLLSQAKMAEPTTVAAEIARLAAFLGASSSQVTDEIVDSARSNAASEIGD